ncbi:MAG: anion permease [Caldilineales bacterium]|nr:anion permease [Caldilineales bacterium]
MSNDLALVFFILFVTIALFVSDRLRLDLIAILVILTLILTGILTVPEALAGFADSTVITIAALFVVGAGLFRTGVADAIGNRISDVAGTNEVRLLVVIMVVVALLSAVLSSTGTTAIFLPVVISLAWTAKVRSSKLLMPLAYASLVGGMLTLIGTPPNIVVSDYLASQGLEPFGFFSFTPVGLVMLAITVIYMVVLGRRLLPVRTARVASTQPIDASDAPSLGQLADSYGLSQQVFRLRVRRNSPLVGKTLAQSALTTRYGVNVLDIQSWPPDRRQPSPPRSVGPESYIDEHDFLRVQGDSEAVTRMAREQSLGIRDAEELGGRFLAEEQGLVEVIVTPRSRLDGRTLKEADFREKYGVTVLALMRRGERLADDLSTITLRFGDTLLVQGSWEQIALLDRERRDMVVVGQPRELIERRKTTAKAPLAILIMLGMLVLMTTGVVSTVTASLMAAAAMVLVGCLSMEDAYTSISWESIILIAGMLPLATALEKTGGIDFIATRLTSGLAGAGPLAAMAVLFLLTSLFSQFISNTATTVLVAPIAYQMAISLGVSPYTLLMTVAIAASTAFATPIASPVNTLVFSPGGYRFADYSRVGVPLLVLILLATLAVVPIIFPL